ncbi:MAG: CvpA family protein [Mariniphaga sp.]|nr:CvpA family protein [Mariniphaga sp.]MDD4225454.1 CvpA family protein [Mariniphaga sp.]MDD4424496.1 CvpA family protein [Mariniphaga sp.]
MNYIDIIIGLILLVAAINGFRKGFVSELASLAALILGIWGAIEFSYITVDLIEKYFHPEHDYINIISFILTFVVIVILVHIIGSSVNKLVEAAMMGFLNKMAGLVFGIVRSALILSIILLLFDRVNKDVEIISPETTLESRLYEPVRNLAPSIFPFIKNWDESTGSDKNKQNILDQLKDTLKT